MFKCQKMFWHDFRRVLVVVCAQFTHYVYIDSIESITRNENHKEWSVLLKNGVEYMISFDDLKDEENFIDGI